MSTLTREERELADAREQMRSAHAAGMEEPGDTGTPDADPPPALDPAPSDPPTGQPPQDDPGTQTPPASDEPPTDQASELAALKQEHASLQARFKALQGAITPTQQERSDLRRQNAALQTELNELKARMTTQGPGTQTQPAAQPVPADLQAKLDAVRSVVPEVADLVEATLAENQRLKSDVGQRLETHDRQRNEEIARAAMGELLRQRPAATQIAGDPAFWTWVDTQGPEAPYYRDILAKPWEGQNLSASIAILDAYTAVKGHAPVGAPPVSAAAQVQARPPQAATPTVQRPTDIGAPARSTARPSTSGTPALLSDSQVLDMDRQMRRGGQEKAKEIVERLRENMRLRARQ